MTIGQRAHLQKTLHMRFGDAERIAEAAPQSSIAALTGLADHRVIRRYDTRPVDLYLVRLLCAIALSAPMTPSNPGIVSSSGDLSAVQPTGAA